MRQNTTLFAFGAAGNSLAQNTVVATLAVTPGRYRIWGNTRHTLADGLKLTIPVALILAAGPNDTAIFGPLVVDVTAALNITVALNVATGASDTASATLYAESINH
jgi:hypothetical protein